ncbi:hypothetical protein MA5S1212_4374 [Mycobacteroides abscessus 5S-1212]|nr:hypothetical protein MA5S1212_4374 [Mycobacteroides abscessus 5S-1212]
MDHLNRSDQAVHYVYFHASYQQRYRCPSGTFALRRKLGTHMDC